MNQVAERKEEKRQWGTYRQIRHIILYRPIPPLEIQQTDAPLLVKWIHQGMKGLEIPEKSSQEVSPEADSRQFHIVMQMHRLHLVSLKGTAPHRLLQECTIASLIEKGISRGVRREEIGNFHDEI